MVVEVTEVPRRLVGHAGYVGDSRVEAADHVAFGRHDLAHLHEGALHLEQHAELRLGGRLEDLVLQVVDLVVELGEDRKEAVDQRADDEIHDDDLWRGDLGDRVALEPILHVRQGRALPPVHRDHVTVRPEAVDLGVAGVIGVGAPGHQVDEVVVRVDPRALPEALGRLDGEMVEAEVGRQKLADHPVGRGVVEVEPEEFRARQRGEHVLRRGVGIAALLAQDPLQHAPVSPRAARPWWMMDRVR